MMERTTGTFFRGDLFARRGTGKTPLTDADLLGPSEAFRGPMDDYARSPNTTGPLERLAGEHPMLVACMHGSA